MAEVSNTGTAGFSAADPGHLQNTLYEFVMKAIAVVLAFIFATAAGRLIASFKNDFKFDGPLILGLLDSFILLLVLVGILGTIAQLHAHGFPYRRLCFVADLIFVTLPLYLGLSFIVEAVTMTDNEIHKGFFQWGMYLWLFAFVVLFVRGLAVYNWNWNRFRLLPPYFSLFHIGAALLSYWAVSNAGDWPVVTRITTFGLGASLVYVIFVWPIAWRPR